MARSARQKVTFAIAAAGILVLGLGGLAYVRTLTNAERIDDRNLRELARLARGVEGRIDNLPAVLRNLSRQRGTDARVRSAALIPHLSVDTLAGARGACETTEDEPPVDRTSFVIDLGDRSLRLCYRPSADDSVFAAFGLTAIGQSLASDYFETVFIADTTGAVFLWWPDRPAVRIRDLAAFDTLRTGVGGRVPVSTIVQVPIAGRDYRFYLLPLRLHLGSAQNGTDHSEWILGGLVRAAAVRQESLSLGPGIALLLAVLALTGFLAAPFVRVFTMGPRERLGAGNLLYLVIALILASGLAGLALADAAHFRPLRSHLHARLEATADTVVRNFERELAAALQELDTLGAELQAGTRGRLALPFERDFSALDPVLLRTRMSPAEGRAVYPNLQMALWTDSSGWQVAKWTPRGRNTSRVDVTGREYFRAIHEGRGWPRPPGPVAASVCAEDDPAAPPPTTTSSIFVESIRSWNTGEKLAAISSRFEWESASRAQPGASHPGVGVIITRLASVDRPVLPPGFEVAVVDTAALTLFHSRAERVLEEDFAEETARPELVRSVLSARACRALDVTYGGRATRLAIRPLPGKPLFLIVLMDRAQLDTIRFEAWFIGAALFGLIALLIIGCFVFHEASAATLIGWAWPDRDRPGRYVVLLAIAALFLVALALHAAWPARFPPHAATFLAPLQLLGLGLVVLAPSRSSDQPDREAAVGWLTFGAATLLFAALLRLWGGSAPVPWPHVLVSLAAPGLLLAWRQPPVRDFIEQRARGVSARVVYTAAMSAGLLVLAVLPGYLAYQVAFHAHSELLVRHHQLGIDDALRARSARVDSIMREDNRHPAYRALLEGQSFDQAFEGLAFATRRREPPAALVPAGTGPWHGTLHRVLADRMPFLTEASVGMRQLAAQQGDRQWRRDPGDARPLDRIWLLSSAPLVAALPPAAGRWDALWLLALLGVLAALALTVYWVSRRVFFIHIEHPEPLALSDALPAPGEEWTSLILIGTRSISRAAIRARGDEVRLIDMRSARVDGDTLTTPLGTDPGTDASGARAAAICLDNFDHCFSRTDWNLALLDFLERLVYAERAVAVLLLMSRDPEASLLAPDAGLQLNAADRLRWARVLGRFTKVMLADLVPPEPLRIAIGLRVTDQLIAELEALAPSPHGERAEPHGAAARLDWLDAELAELERLTRTADPGGRPAARVQALRERRRSLRVRLDAARRADAAAAAKAAAAAERTVARRRRQVERARSTLLAECGRGERLQQIACQIIARPGWHELSRGELLDLIREGADSYYAALWAILSEQERLVAAQLAHGAIVNPRSHQAVTRLFARGVIERAPELRLKNESLARFVRETAPRDVLTRWERADTPSTWEIVRAPLLLGWIGVALFLFWAQRDLLGNAIAFLSTAGVGLAAIVRVVTMFERPGASSSQASS